MGKRAETKQLFNALLETLEAIQNKPAIPAAKQRWNSADCAQYLRIKQRYFTSNIACKPDFPNSVRLKAGRGRGNPTWLMMEVIKWVERQ